MDYSVGVKAINTCGVSATYSEIHLNPCYQGGFYYSYFPNPASELLIIEKNELSASEENSFVDGSVQNNHYYKVYNLTTNTVVFEGILSDKTEIDVSTLSKGSYVLKIRTGKNTEEAHHIIIN